MREYRFYTQAQLSYAVFMDYIMDRVRRFSILDFGIFKLCILSIGMIIGSFFSKCLKKCTPVLVIIALASYAYLIYKLFFEEE